MKNLKRLIFLMCLSIIGVLLLQGRWISLSFNDSKTQFDNSVRHAVIKAFEDERTSQFTPDLQKYINIVSVYEKRNCLEEPTEKQLNDSTVSFVVTCAEGDSTYEEEHEIVIRAFPTNYLLTEPRLDTHKLYLTMASIGSRMANTPLDMGIVESKLTRRLHEQGIALAYNLNFYGKNQCSIQLSASDHKVKMAGGLAVVRFKGQTSFLIVKMWAIIFGSFVLSGLAIFSLVFMLYTIMKQKHLSEMKNDFISNMTHELKTPISVISAANEAMLNFNVLEDKKKTTRYLQIAKNELERLALMVEKVLQAAQFEKKKINLRPEPICIPSILEALVEKHQLNSSKQIHFELSNALKEESINLDKMHFSNVLNNLIDNAVKYSGDDVHIKATLEEKEDQISIMIADTGKGMSKEGIKRAFEKFYREPTGNIHNIKGFGLGLHYVKSVVEMIGGNVLVQSQLGKGSQFIISIPK